MDPAIETLWKRYVARRLPADRDALIGHYLPVVRQIAGRLKSKLPPDVQLEDLVQTGVFGLLDAIDSFQPDRGYKFETFSQLRIRGAMLDGLRQMDWVPRLVRAKAARLAKATEDLVRKLGRPPTSAELARRLSMKVRELEQMQRDVEPVGFVSLEKKRFETESHREVREVDLVADPRQEIPASRLALRESMRLLLCSLGRTDRLLMVGYYWEGLTMKQIGEQLGLSESRVSQKHSQIIESLQRRLVDRRPNISAA